MIAKIISGGQTGVDRAALDVAMKLHIPHGGWCPAGRAAEDGKIPGRYQLLETPSSEYNARTRKNVEDCDGVLVLNQGKLDGGTALTLVFARQMKRPHMLVDLDSAPSPGIGEVRDWLSTHDINVCNVAGPRESKRRGIYCSSARFLESLLRQQKHERANAGTA